MAASRGPGPLDRLETKLDKLTERVEKTERFQAWVSGLAVGVGFVAGFFSDFLKKHLGM